MYKLEKFNNLYNLILEENSFDILNPNDFPKAIKYNNFPENVNEINITNKLLQYNLNEDISKVILTQHCVKSIKDNEIHGINYINLPSEKFFKFITYCINNSLNELLNRKNPINLYYDKFRVEEEFEDITTGISYKIGFESNAQSIYEVEIRLITIFYSSTHQTNLQRNIKTTSGQKTSYITKKLFL